MSTVAPEILWAQRSSADEAEKNVVMLTINVPNLPTPPATKFDLTSTGFNFHAKTGDTSKGIPDKEYQFSLEFFDEIDVEASKTHLNSKCLYAVLRKKNAKEEYWPRLTKDKLRLHNVKTDFDKWVDEDEQDENEEDLSGGMGGMGGGMGGMDPSMMNPAMMGAGGAGGFDLQSMMAQMGGGMGGMGGMPDFGGMDDDQAEGDDEDDVEDAPAAPAADEAK
ncbi:related to SBA1 - Hsp90 associated co-chaperone [Melanopsichium pennsylvanicum]|uniref:Related to SBA1 - Hsp90 associated co-chaperone n=2 Tax=Melanopsichium pennsylvanicum TaxID=63383 RepID=A0AAJ4XNE4_9BASI|nr:related to SBA1-Hsp90 associated co-chaperone [Melanopsichium pennsylvanicum 4]SNX85805.1 related to SBA1 - Hsp90 associated co-chaperone [Melanopsichium pennsylvanicum]